MGRKRWLGSIGRLLPGNRASVALALSPLLLNAPPARAQRSTMPVKVLFGATPVSALTADRTPFRDMSDGAVCVAPEALTALGIACTPGSADRFYLTGPEGGPVAAILGRNVPGARGLYVNAIEAIEALGGRCQWDAGRSVLYVRSVLSEIAVQGDQIRVRASLPVLPKLTYENGRRRLIVDFPGAEVGALPRALNLGAADLLSARVGQFEPDVARLVLEFRQPVRYRVGGAAPATQVALMPGGAPAPEPPPVPLAESGKPLPPRSADPGRPTETAKSTSGTVKPTETANPPPGAVKPATVAVKPSADTISPPPQGKPVAARVAAAPAGETARPAARSKAESLATLSAVSLQGEGDERAHLLIRSDRSAPVRAALARDRLTLDFQNVRLAAQVAAGIAEAGHPLLRTLRLLPAGSKAARLVVDLTQTVGFALRLDPRGGLRLDLSLLRNADGPLAGKLVVVDPGHGGSDSGARGVDGTLEKNNALAIAQMVAAELQSQGANVILTRDCDAFVTLAERSFIANRSGADLFVSIHCDSGDNNRSVNGSTVYYHMDVSPCRGLAQSIAARLGTLGEIRSKGTRSDSIRFPRDGFSVLRRSQMLSVLVECGYMTHAGDVARLSDPAARQRIAAAIAAGVSDYVSAHPEMDTRLIRRQSDGGGVFDVPPPEVDPATGVLVDPASPGAAGGASGPENP